MRVTSPVGAFPYTLERVRVEGRTLVVHGRMGAWPSRIEVQLSDVPQLARLLRAPLLASGALVALGVVVGRRRSAHPARR